MSEPVSPQPVVPVARRPRPSPDERSLGYWAAIAEGRLAIQRCNECRRWQHPPVAACLNCHSLDLVYEDVDGRGVIHQRVVVHQTKISGFESLTPYAAVTVELAEQRSLFVVGNIVNAEPEQVLVGQGVHVVFDASDTGVLAQFAIDWPTV